MSTKNWITFHVTSVVTTAADRRRQRLKDAECGEEVELAASAKW